MCVCVEKQGLSSSQPFGRRVQRKSEERNRTFGFRVAHGPTPKMLQRKAQEVPTTRFCPNRVLSFNRAEPSVVN